MKIEGTAPTQGPDGRRFSAAKSAPPKEGGKSFGALLKKAAEDKTVPPAETKAPAAPASEPESAAIHVATPLESKTPAETGASADAPESFANHMEMVKLRLKSGYYNNANVDDALSEKLTGFFDDLA